MMRRQSRACGIGTACRRCRRRVWWGWWRWWRLSLRHTFGLNPFLLRDNTRMSALGILLFALALAVVAPAQQAVSFVADDGGTVCADLYGQNNGQGSRAVVLATAADLTKRAGVTRHRRWNQRGFECWRSTSEVTVARKVRARRISTVLPLRKMCSLRFVI